MKIKDRSLNQMLQLCFLARGAHQSILGRMLNNVNSVGKMIFYED